MRYLVITPPSVFNHAFHRSLFEYLITFPSTIFHNNLLQQCKGVRWWDHSKYMTSLTLLLILSFSPLTKLYRITPSLLITINSLLKNQQKRPAFSIILDVSSADMSTLLHERMRSVCVCMLLSAERCVSLSVPVSIFNLPRLSWLRAMYHTHAQTRKHTHTTAHTHISCCIPTVRTHMSSLSEHQHTLNYWQMNVVCLNAGKRHN